MRDVVLLTYLLHRLKLCGKITHLFIEKRYAFSSERVLQIVQICPEQGRLPGGHIVLPPLLGRGHKQCQYVSVFGAAGCRKGDVVMYAQVRAKPNQMGGHKTPGNYPLCP